MTTTVLTPDDFEVLGRKVARIRHSNSEKVRERRFKAEFGVPTYIATVAWEMLEDSSFLRDNNPGKKPPNPEHMLWALLLLKKYDTVGSLANTVRADEQTFQKWSRLYLEALAELDSILVSHQVLFSFVLIVCFESLLTFCCCCSSDPVGKPLRRRHIRLLSCDG